MTTFCVDCGVVGREIRKQGQWAGRSEEREAGSAFSGCCSQSVASDQRRKCSPVVALSTPGNQQAVDGDNQRDRLPAGLSLSGLI
jgi:hypothetical protein